LLRDDTGIFYQDRARSFYGKKFDPANDILRSADMPEERGCKENEDRRTGALLAQA